MEGLLSNIRIVLSTTGRASSIYRMISSIKKLYHFIILKIVLIIIFFIINLFLAHAIGKRGEKQGLRVKIIRIVLQTLTFTSGTLGLAPAYHGSVLLSDSRHGNYLTNKARSLVFTTTLSPLFFYAVGRLLFFALIPVCTEMKNRYL
jgi:7-keto-8-aminopelargonate synthetase-like enzyme